MEGIYENASALLCLAFIFILQIALAIWAYQDAKRFGQSGCLIAMLIGFTGPLGLMIWLIMRSSYPNSRRRKSRRRF